MSFKYLVLPKNEPDSLAVIDRAAGLIVQARSLDETRMLKTLFDFAQRQARQKKLEGMEKNIIEYKFMLLDKTGELISDMKEKGELASGKDNLPRVENIDSSKKTLADLKISKDESSEAQKFHKLPDEEKKQVVEKAKAKVGVKVKRPRVIPSPQPPVFTTGAGKPVELDHKHLWNFCGCGAQRGVES